MKKKLFIIFITMSACSYLPRTQKVTSAKKTPVVNDKATKVTKKIEVIRPVLLKPKLTMAISKYCQKIDRKFKRYRWENAKCDHYNWKHVRNSVIGDPLIWMVYGNELEHRKVHRDTTMIFCGVHGDEITPIKFCFDILNYLQANKDLYKNKIIVVAPLVNPDSFLKRRPTRINHRKVDINRNFPTKDWQAKALKTWRHRYRSNKRRYPGKRPLSEPEVLFQVNLIKRYRPDKIISVHAPLTILDYDGPDKKHDHEDQNLRARNVLAGQLLIQMSRQASGYRIKDYPFFPGSLGNWAGNERNIPTYTLELPSSDPAKSNEYWILFNKAIVSAFKQDLHHEAEVAMKKHLLLKEEKSSKL